MMDKSHFFWSDIPCPKKTGLDLQLTTSCSSCLLFGIHAKGILNPVLEGLEIMVLSVIAFLPTTAKSICLKIAFDGW